MVLALEMTFGCAASDVNTWVVLASGTSVNQALADRLRGQHVIAVSDAYRLAPWADALASNDARWWRNHPFALDFAGRKFACSEVGGVERVPMEGPISTGSNSGLLALYVAVKYFEAKRVLLCGIDLHGDHFFGPHVGMTNTTPSRFDVFQRQFMSYKPQGVEILNCSPISRLRAYRRANLEDCLAESPTPA